MKINSHKSLSLSLLVALPFLGGVHECEGPAEPEPEPEPVLCFSDAECGAGEYCNTDLCLSPCDGSPGMACPAVCYGACEPAPEPTYCSSDADCGAFERCNTDACMSPPCGGEAELTVCYGVCEPEPSACDGVMCDLYCEVYARDERGCEICACDDPPPPPMCEPVVCTLYCEDGFRTDDRGCPICDCAPPPPMCEPVTCEIWCEYGFRTDETGCEICACNEPPSGGNCGGFAGFSCAMNEWCDFDADVPACGAADHLGTCRPRPEVCPEIYGPVCGCDGASYPNECYANAAGVDVTASGLCAPPMPGR